MYIQPRGRWKRGRSAVAKRSSQEAAQDWETASPEASPAPSRASPILIQSPPPADGWSAPTLEARGPSALRSKSVNQSEPCGWPPGRLWTV